MFVSLKSKPLSQFICSRFVSLFIMMGPTRYDQDHNHLQVWVVADGHDLQVQSVASRPNIVLTIWKWSCKHAVDGRGHLSLLSVSFQIMRSLTILREKCSPIEEFPIEVPNHTRMRDHYLECEMQFISGSWIVTTKWIIMVIIYKFDQTCIYL